MKKFILIGSLILAGCMPNYSDGTRVGVVSKLSHKGAMWKSWEGEMNLGGFRNKSDGEGRTTVVANVFAFTVKDPAVVEQVQKAMQSGEVVELHYTQWAFGPLSQDTSYDIVAVKQAQ